MRNIHKGTPPSFRRRENAAAIVKAPPPGALTKGPDRKFPGLHPPPGGATSPSLSTNRRFAFPILALLAALAVGLLFLLPGGDSSKPSRLSPSSMRRMGRTPVATFTATDPEGESIVWSVADDNAGEFTIVNGVLRFKSAPDFENPQGGTDNESVTYQVTVQASDGGAAATTAMEPVTIEVTNVEEPGTITLSTLQPQVGVVITAMLTDPDNIGVDKPGQYLLAVVPGATVPSQAGPMPQTLPALTLLLPGTLAACCVLRLCTTTTRAMTRQPRKIRPMLPGEAPASNVLPRRSLPPLGR